VLPQTPFCARAQPLCHARALPELFRPAARARAPCALASRPSARALPAHLLRPAAHAPAPPQPPVRARAQPLRHARALPELLRPAARARAPCVLANARPRTREAFPPVVDLERRVHCVYPHKLVARAHPARACVTPTRGTARAWEARHHPRLFGPQPTLAFPTVPQTPVRARAGPLRNQTHAHAICGVVNRCTPCPRRLPASSALLAHTLLVPATPRAPRALRAPRATHHPMSRLPPCPSQRGHHARGADNSSMLFALSSPPSASVSTSTGVSGRTNNTLSPLFSSVRTRVMKQMHAIRTLPMACH
jgi:hypothetical protein